MKTAQQIADYTGGTLSGDGATPIHTVASLERGQPGAIAFAEASHLDAVPRTAASCVLVSAGDFPGQTVIVVDRPRVAFARVAAWLLPAERPFSGIHPTAIVDETAELADDVALGAWTVIEAGVRIGRGTVIFPGCYIGRGCRIGQACTVHPQVVAYPGVTIADRVMVHAGVVLGSDGFGFVYDGERQVKLPQAGHLRIGSDVEIGANTCIDRGALDDTVIDEGVKLDNLCQIAHNVQVGAHATLSSQTGVAGSSHIGARAALGGQVGIGDHCRIDDDAIIGGQGGVPSRKRVPGRAAYWGTPARPLKDIKAQQALLNRLPKVAEEMKLLRTELDALRATLEARPK